MCTSVSSSRSGSITRRGHQVFALATGMPGWRVGDDFEAFVDRVHRIPLPSAGEAVYRHQMDSCRMARIRRKRRRPAWRRMTPGSLDRGRLGLSDPPAPIR